MQRQTEQEKIENAGDLNRDSGPHSREVDYVGQYYEEIVDMLDVSSDELKRSWGGVASVLELYEDSVGKKREAIIQAMEKVLENADRHPIIAAQVLSLVNALNLTQVHDSVVRLQKMEIARDAVLSREINNYFAFQETYHHIS